MSTDAPASDAPLELSILMPCLNEALTVATCVAKARAFLERESIRGEVLVADNGSTDGSQALAEAAGARVVAIRQKGYGAALIGGIEAARGRFVIMGDSDDSYDFTRLGDFVVALRSGVALVIGNRFKGGIRDGAMPLLNRYLGNPVLSFIGRTLFSSEVGDFHCGLRGFDRQAILALELRASGMEFASEMVVKASLAGLRIGEVPTTLNPDGRDRAPHLRPWRDGWRHLSFMLLRSPMWLFLYPGLALTALGITGVVLLAAKPRTIPGLFTLDINALLYCSIAAIVGIQVAFFGLFAMSLAGKMRLRIARGFPDRLLALAGHRATALLGLCLAVTGAAGAIHAFRQWDAVAFGALVPSEMMRITIPAVSLLAIGTQILFDWLLLGFIEIE